MSEIFDAIDAVGAAAGAALPPRRIWLCADDYGISPGVNAAIRDLIARGRINATSVMVVAPSLHRAEAAALAALNEDRPRAAIGLHVTLTAPFRPSTECYAPTRDDTFLSIGASLMRASLRRLVHDHLVGEIENQIRMFVDAFGRAPDFIDGHQHVHVLPQVRDAFLQAVQAKAPDAWVRQCGGVIPATRKLDDPKGLLLDRLSRSFTRRAAAQGVRTNAAFAGTYTFNERADFATLFPRFLEGLPDASVVMCHPGLVDAELRRLDPLTTLREHEYRYLMGDAFPAVLRTHRVALA